MNDNITISQQKNNVTFCFKKYKKLVIDGLMKPTLCRNYNFKAKKSDKKLAQSKIISYLCIIKKEIQVKFKN